jgi:hypothetical protein
MFNDEPRFPTHQPAVPKPYCSVGAGRLTSFVWKSGDENSGWRYRFNLFRLAAKGGRVSQLLAPSDLIHLIKLAQVLSAVIADDGCLSFEERDDLRRLAADLDTLGSRMASRAAANPRPKSKFPSVRGKPGRSNQGGPS